ncbi:MAG: hypothetical protein LQ337_006343 [Flavoplaca oasis]|nr:MAG: hypothetical protein LQ337_006343 [Flavoplaca oasis]
MALTNIEDYSPALQSACANGDLDLATSLYNDAIKARPSARMSLLKQMAITSARHAHPNILSLSFAAGLRERKFTCNDEILYAACSASYPIDNATIIPIFAVLLDEGGLDVNHWLEGVGDVLKAAVDQGNIELVKYLFSKGADPNSDRCAPHGDNIAIIGAIIGDRNQHSTEMLRVLFENGTKLHETGALRAAAEYSNLDAVKMIFEMKSDEVELEEADYVSDFTGTQYPEVTALYKAAAEGHSAIVDILVRNGANIGFKDASGRSVIDIARANGHKDLAIRLEQLMSLDPCEKGRYTN